MLTVVVTGVAGSLGRRVAELLVADPTVGRIIGIDVPAGAGAGRSNQSTAGLGAAVDLHLLDLATDADTGGLGELFARADVVIHLAWHTPDGPNRAAAQEQRIAQANQRALRRVLDAVDAAGVRQIIHLSSATVYGAWPDNPVPLTELAPLRPNPEFHFAVDKAEAERQLAEWAEDHPAVEVSILRPAVTVGTPQRPLYQALGATRTLGGGEGNRPVQYLHVDDLAAAVVAVMTGRHTGVLNVAPDSGITESVARALVGGVARVTMPRRVAAAVASWSWRLWRSGVPKEARAYSLHPWVVAIDRLRATGWTPQYSSEEALVATDARPHWDDLPPGTRQNFTLLITISGVVAAAGAIGTAVTILRRRRQSATG
ncbi:MAG: NAD-dependent epimerase/dehydratase family protein [Actinomycetota bacterium]|nr:NAD-dependent epimerase/dehydratase family protein [Actinomycetota bacterium]